MSPPATNAKRTEPTGMPRPRARRTIPGRRGRGRAATAPVPIGYLGGRDVRRRGLGSRLDVGRQLVDRRLDVGRQRAAVRERVVDLVARGVVLEAEAVVACLE